ncbi:MAG TPA: hypothetical protein VFD92_05520 [Candidatus Binatia bacterium]|nr:hypothetical protein [Candidatus Binatia bacterium]
MRFLRVIAAFMAASSLVGSAGAAASDDEDVWHEARAASCSQLIDAYEETVVAERKLVSAMRDSKAGTIATNVIGAATLAGLGVGFFTWNDDESADENLADLRNDLRIIRTVSAEKKCDLPAEADIG